MPDSPSLLSFLAAAFYGLVVASCLLAAREARVHHQQPWHGRIWLALALLFIVLIASRLLSIEDIVRADLRSWLRSEGLIEGRRVWQRWLIAGSILAAALAGFFAAYRMIGRVTGRRNIAVVIAASCSGIMVCIISLRLISLHAMDRLLYGPFKLNWVGDIGASSAIIAAAVYYIWVIKQPPGKRRR